MIYLKVYPAPNGARFNTTRGHKTCRFQWVFERFVSPRGFVKEDTEAAQQSGTFHTAKRCASCKKDRYSSNTKF